jgi:hypothetical protein
MHACTNVTYVCRYIKKKKSIPVPMSPSAHKQLPDALCGTLLPTPHDAAEMMHGGGAGGRGEERRVDEEGENLGWRSNYIAVDEDGEFRMCGAE